MPTPQYASEGRLMATTVTVDAVKAAYTTRHVRLETFERLLTAGRPDAGDLVLARVVELGQHRRLELCDGRRAALYVGDEIVVAYGNRYAPDQYEAVVPDDLGPCELVAAGGIAGRALCWHTDIDEPTRLEPIGLLADATNRRVNLRDWRLPEPPNVDAPPWTVVVAGTSMNAGKTTTAAAIIHGLCRAGRRVAAAKITGTGAGGDVWLMGDAGANPVLDFTAAGFASTYLCSPEEVLSSLRVLYGHVASTQPDVVVLEIADGMLQCETAALLASRELAALADAVVFAAGDAMGAIDGVARLRSLGLPVIAVSGLLTASPLATRETAAALDLPVLTVEDLLDGHPFLALPVRSGAVSGAR